MSFRCSSTLSDVSATRALCCCRATPAGWAGRWLSGDAERFAAKFTVDAVNATNAAVALRRRDTVELLEETKAAFVAYHIAGREMAQADVDAGPAGGNRMMHAAV